MDDTAIAAAILSGERAVIVYDLEGTCWKGVWSRQKETIEIGAVCYRFGVADRQAFQTYVKPIAIPRISAFCTGLTGITQGDVDDAPTFPGRTSTSRSCFVACSKVLQVSKPLSPAWGSQRARNIAPSMTREWPRISSTRSCAARVAPDSPFDNTPV